MKYKTKVFLLIGTFVVTAAIVAVLMYNGYHSSSSGIRKYLHLIVAATGPVALMYSLNQPAYYIRKVLGYISVDLHTYENKKKYCCSFVTKDFKESDKYRSLLNLGKCQISEMKQGVSDSCGKYVTVNLKDGRDIEFEVVKKTKDNSNNSKDNTKWLISDFKRVGSRKV